MRLHIFQGFSKDAIEAPRQKPFRRINMALKGTTTLMQMGGNIWGRKYGGLHHR